MIFFHIFPALFPQLFPADRIIYQLPEILFYLLRLGVHDGTFPPNRIVLKKIVPQVAKNRFAKSHALNGKTGIGPDHKLIGYDIRLPDLFQELFIFHMLRHFQDDRQSLRLQFTNRFLQVSRTFQQRMVGSVNDLEGFIPGLVKRGHLTSINTAQVKIVVHSLEIFYVIDGADYLIGPIFAVTSISRNLTFIQAFIIRIGFISGQDAVTIVLVPQGHLRSHHIPAIGIKDDPGSR